MVHYGRLRFDIVKIKFVGLVEFDILTLSSKTWGMAKSFTESGDLGNVVAIGCR